MSSQENNPKLNIEFFMPDVSWKDFPLSTKESFLLITEQALSVNADGFSYEMSSDAKGQILLLMGEKAISILKISSGVFDKYWSFLTKASESEFGLKIKYKDRDEIRDLAIDVQQPQSERRIVIRFSPLLTESDFFPADEK